MELTWKLSRRMVVKSRYEQLAIPWICSRLAQGTLELQNQNHLHSSRPLVQISWMYEPESWIGRHIGPSLKKEEPVLELGPSIGTLHGNREPSQSRSARLYRNLQQVRLSVLVKLAAIYYQLVWSGLTYSPFLTTRCSLRRKGPKNCGTNVWKE